MNYVGVRGLIRRVLPASFIDSTEQLLRLGRYGEQFTVNLFNKHHALADEGCYFTANNGQTGIAGPAVATFGATTPIAVIANSDTNTSSGKRLYLDQLKLITTAAGSWASAGVNLQLVVVTDVGDRYTSGGTVLTAKNANQDSSNASIALVRFGAITATAATGAARTQVGLDIARPSVSATVAGVVGERWVLNFGQCEAAINGSITVASANSIPIPLPPIIIGPSQSALIYLIMNGTTPAAMSFEPEFAWFER